MTFSLTFQTFLSSQVSPVCWYFLFFSFLFLFYWHLLSNKQKKCQGLHLRPYLCLLVSTVKRGLNISGSLRVCSQWQTSSRSLETLGGRQMWRGRFTSAPSQALYSRQKSWSLPSHLDYSVSSQTSFPCEQGPQQHLS